MKAIINYFDVILYENDLNLFHNGYWLNDQCINFCFRWYENSKYKSMSSILFMDPAVVSFLKLQCDDEDDYKDLSRGLNLDSREILFIPINDNSSFTSSSNHWSLLFVIKDSGVIIHLDSAGNYNEMAAGIMAIKIYKLLER